MDESHELLAALEAIQPAALDYGQWTAVGMALKQAGAPVQVWDDWSRRDPARYHAGECARKWQTFQGSANPVTAASIFDLAHKQGWTSTGVALDWDSVISVDAPALLAPGWVETQDLVIPEDRPPVDQLVQYLRALFEPSEYVGFVTDSFEKHGKWLPKSAGRYDMTAGQLIDALEACGGDIGAVIGDTKPAAGAWIRFNPLDGHGCKNENVAEYRYALLECDDGELAQQNTLIRQLELPCAALVYSGGKSLHAIVHIDAADKAEYQRRVEYLYKVCEKNGLQPDRSAKNESRLSRMPGVARGDKRQVLLGTHLGKAGFVEWRDWVEEATDDLPDTERIADVWDSLPPLAAPLIDGVLRCGHKMLLAGPSKAGKSFALIELCIAIAEGIPWLGRFPCATGRVLYINLELDRASCLHRFRDVYQALAIIPKGLHNIDLWNLRGTSVPLDKLAPKLIRRSAKRGYLAIVLDPIYKVITGDENSADQMAKFCNQFDKVCTELGCAAIYCHHHSKGLQGQKRSMDRASGSGVFARDPDALLDLIELEISDDLRQFLQDKAVCAACCQLLEEAGKLEEVGLDDRQSAFQMQAAAQKLLGADGRLDAALEAAKARAAAQSAWRIEGTLREFARFAPVDLWFDYPAHRLDDSGVLADIQPEKDTPFGGIKAAKKRWGGEKGKKQREDEDKEAFETAYASLASLNGQVTTYQLAEYLGKSVKTVQRRVATLSDSYWLDGEKVGRKEAQRAPETHF